MNNIFIALDFPTWQQAKTFIDDHAFHGVPVKVGMELFYREGPDIIYELKRNEHPIFLDLKLHDIPNTVMGAMKNLAQLHVDIVNVHATGGSEMIKWAKEGLLQGTQDHALPQLIAVTVLTSFEEQTLHKELKVHGQLDEYAIHLAQLSQASGADGVVCSVHEAKQIKKVCGPSFVTVTPGIRLQEADQGDQKRIATPKYARQHGSDILVIGRSITQADNPRLAYEQCLKEWTNDNE